MNAAQLINQTSGDVEIYTPGNIIEAARRTLSGTISLDPASSEEANRRVQALRWYGREADGLNQPWEAQTLWMNHPFSKAGNKLWIDKLVMSFRQGQVREACCITFASTSEKWFQPLMAFPQCYLSPRTNYLRPDGSVYRGVTKGSVVTYLGHYVGNFRAAFAGMGTVKV